MTLNKTRSSLYLAIGLSIASTSALASPQANMSARSFAMGGTGVAVAHPSAAASTNPAMMAAKQHEWVDDFGVTIPSINARFADEEEVIDQIDDIQDSIDDFDYFFSQIDNSSATADDIDAFQATAGDLNDRLNAFSNDTMRVNVGAGLSLAVPSPNLAVGVFANGNLTATVRGELDESDSKLLSDIAGASTVQDVEKIIDDAERDSKNNLALNSKGRILASAVTEVGVSFARTFDIQGETVQLGVSPKFVKLQTFQYSEGVADFDDDDFDADDYETDKTGFSMDVGAAYAFGENNEWNAGVVVKNLIPMELDSAQARKDQLDEKQHTLKLAPMVTAGIAHSGDFHVLTAELDLTKKEAFGYEDDTQWLAVGAEFDAWRWAQLRAGVRHNLASNSDNDGIEEDTQFTAGLGLNAFGARLDLGALYSSADVGAAIEFGIAF